MAISSGIVAVTKGVEVTAVLIVVVVVVVDRLCMFQDIEPA